MLPVQQGRLQYNGEDYQNNFKAIRNTIGVVFQNPSIDKKLTVRENLHCQVYIYGSTPSRESERINELVQLFDLSKYLDQKLETLSGGYQRRVELAKCMLHNPAVILLDEPSTGLDIVSRRDLWRYLKTIRDQRNVTVLVTTHIIDEAEQCDRVIILNEGELVVSGAPSVLKDEIGSEILSLKSEKIASVLSLLQEKWNIEGVQVDGTVRVELQGNRKFINQLLTDHLDIIDSATISKPSLADVFFNHTGNKFDELKEQEQT